mmetsp:Transcript_15033/g.26364  ORF Transcript_15033/g.26364 Transcript_15033/m.26364 type:complete len:432 (+) Transcript_15033:2180-3475(+)
MKYLQLLPWLVVAFAVVTADQETNFDIKLGNGVKDCYVNVRLYNNNPGDRFFVIWDSPFEMPIRNRVFESDLAVYSGPIVERGRTEISRKDVQLVEAGGYFSTDVNLCTIMNFPSKGNYSIKATFDLMLIDGATDETTLQRVLEDGVTEAETLQTLLESNTITMLRQEQSLTSFREAEQDDEQENERNLARRRNKYLQCSRWKRRAINTAINRAKRSVTDSLTELPGGKWYNSFEADRKYWLGVPTQSASDNDIKANFLKIKAALVQKTARYSCGGEWCDDGTYAYVYPTDKRKTVYLCGAFWKAPTSAYKRDSRPGTIIHELAHFDSIAGTDDFAYGSSAIRRLARNSPGKARRNSDNLEAFTETYAGEHGVQQAKTSKGRCEYSASITLVSGNSCPKSHVRYQKKCYRRCDVGWKFKHGTCVRRVRIGC